MRDALVFHTGIGAAAIVSVALAIAPHEVTVESDPLPILELPQAGPPISDADRALELATQRFGDPKNPFELFSAARIGDRRAVFVRRQTGGCGGCGALTIAVVFRGDDVVVEQLGEFGRFGNGPQAIRLREVVGHPVIEVDDTMSKGGFSDTFREYFAIERDRIEWELCLKIAGNDGGAHEKPSMWSANVWIANEGTMYFVPDYTKRGEATPQLYAFSFAFENGRWKRPEDEGRCIDPQATEAYD